MAIALVTLTLPRFVESDASLGVIVTVTQTYTQTCFL